MAVAVETAEAMMTRMPKKTVEKSVLRLRRGQEDWIFPQGKAARRENPEADALMVHVSMLFDDPVAEEKPKVRRSECGRVTVTVIGGRGRVGKEMRTSTVQ